MKMERIIIQLPKVLKQNLDTLKAQGYTASGYIRAILEKSLKEPQAKKDPDYDSEQEKQPRSRRKVFQQVRYTMRIPAKEITYTVAWHDQERGIPFCHESHFRNKKKALEEMKKIQGRLKFKPFLAKVTVEPVPLNRAR